MFFRSKYIAFLEAEIARLQERERKLLNVVLPRLGYNPIDEPARTEPPKKPKNRRPTWLQWGLRGLRASMKEKTEVYIPRADRGEKTDATPKNV